MPTSTDWVSKARNQKSNQKLERGGPPPKLLVPWLVTRGAGFADEIKYAFSLFPRPRYICRWLTSKQRVKSRYWRFFLERGILRGFFLLKTQYFLFWIIEPTEYEANLTFNSKNNNLKTLMYLMYPVQQINTSRSAIKSTVQRKN